MLKKYLNVSAVLVATASLTLAQPPGGRGRDEGPDSNVDRMFNHDGNEDGKLGKDEVPERLQGIFARADKDEDGFLNKEEVRAYFQSQAEGQGRGRGGREGGGGREGARSREGGGRGGFGGRGESGAGPGGPRDMPPFPVMMALDADGNGEISADEINNATAALKKLDRNRNGKLDADELRPSFGGGREGGFGGGPQVVAAAVSADRALWRECWVGMTRIKMESWPATRFRNACGIAWNRSTRIKTRPSTKLNWKL